MDKKTAWRLAGAIAMVFGGCGVAWGVFHLNEPPLPTSLLFGGPRVDTSLQLGRTFGGIALVLLGYMAYRQGTKDA